ncbi:MAG: BglG family transcription antiterminator LicT [Clostridium sp.]
MVIKKIFNNNAVLAKDSSGKEFVAMGCGIAFKKNSGELLEKKKIEKTFILKEKEVSEKFKILLEDIPSEQVSLCYDIVEYAKNILQVELNDYIYVTLTDHINNTIKLYKEGIKRPNVLIWEIKKFYTKEFNVGIKAIEAIKDELGIDLGEEEAGNIALHLINAEVNNSFNRAEDIGTQTKIISDILNIVKYSYNIVLDENSLSYERFVTHLRFFFKRLQNREAIEVKEEDFLLKQVKEKYKEAYRCMLKVEKYLKQELNDEEKLYLTLHIERITS